MLYDDSAFADPEQWCFQFARPSLSKPAEHLILERRRREEVRDLAVSQVQHNKHFDLKVSPSHRLMSMREKVLVHRILC